MTLAIFGIRHHGPGSARSVADALADFAPDAVLIEGPPEADGIAELAGDPEMVPPVAILAYAPERPAAAVFYPFAAFSPEWQALRYARERLVPASFVDLPLAHVLADETREPRGDGDDPLDRIARVAGHADGESWWDRFVERRGAPEAFEALEELMRELRVDRDTPLGERRREAAMRLAIRRAGREHERVAVVCGAWHAPALRITTSAKDDMELLRGLPKVKVAATWIPWTNGRLSAASGYGAGVTSPGWYEHLWETRAGVVPAWMAKAARALRDAGLDVAASHAIEATRLAETLAALREAPAVGLDDATDAIRAIYAFGEAAPMRLLDERLIVGERLGHVPERVTRVPLLADLAAEQKRLRLAPDLAPRALDLDLRKPLDLDRSRLLHRLSALGVPWGRARDDAATGTGTFWERWQLAWEPEFALALIEASPYGNRIASAATARVVERAARATVLAELTATLDATLRGGLGDAVEPVLRSLDALAARTHDVALVLDAIPPLARVRRYGDVRQTDARTVAAVLATLVIRACLGVPDAMRSLDDGAAAAMERRLGDVDAALRLSEVAAQREAWETALRAIAADDRVHGLVCGRASRLLYDRGTLDIAAFQRFLAIALGRATAPEAAAAWIEGAFRDSGTILVHESRLLDALDTWLQTLDLATFTATLPLVRRTFGTFAAAERTSIARELARRPASGGADAGAEAAGPAIVWRRARLAVPVLLRIFGTPDRARAES